MHFVEIKRWQDFFNPGSVDKDPLFPQNSLKPHEVGYPGFAFIVPGDMEVRRALCLVVFGARLCAVGRWVAQPDSSWQVATYGLDTLRRILGRGAWGAAECADAAVLWLASLSVSDCT